MRKINDFKVSDYFFILFTLVDFNEVLTKCQKGIKFLDKRDNEEFVQFGSGYRIKVQQLAPEAFQGRRVHMWFPSCPYDTNIFKENTK